jgi:hypothetical protein
VTGILVSRVNGNVILLDKYASACWPFYKDDQ